MNTRCAILLVSLAASAGPALAVNLIDARFGAGAGSFELGDFQDPDGDSRMLVNGSSPVTGWTYLDEIRQPTRFQWLSTPAFVPRDGGKFLDLVQVSGVNFLDGGIGVRVQNAGAAGDRYRLSLDGYGVRGFFDAGFNLEATGLGSRTVMLGSNWSTYSWEFTAPSDSVAISLRTWYGPLGTGHVYVDNVVLENLSAVPEPGTVAALALGAAALAARRRRRT